MKTILKNVVIIENNVLELFSLRSPSVTAEMFESDLRLWSVSDAGTCVSSQAENIASRSLFSRERPREDPRVYSRGGPFVYPSVLSLNDLKLHKT